MKPALPRLLLVTDDSVDPERVGAVWREVGGCDGVALSVRYSHVEARALAALCERLARHGTVVVSRRLDIARCAGMAGVHLPARGVSTSEARAYLGSDALIIRAAHDEKEVSRATAGEADGVLISPVFAPRSHAPARELLGLEGLERLVRSSAVPVIALGGIDELSAADVKQRGVHGVAVVGAVWRAARPVEAVHRLLRTPARAQV